MDVDLPALIKRLNRHCTRCFESAAGRCVSLGHYEVTVEHVLAALLEVPGSDVPLLLAASDIEGQVVETTLGKHLSSLRTGATQRPVLSPFVIEWVQQAWLLASIDHGAASIRSAVLLQALSADSRRWCSGDHARLLSTIPRKDPAQDDALAASSERQLAAPPSASPLSPADGALARFCTSYTERARAGALDPIFGRDSEIRQVIDILSRRRKNNPICVGDPGVGKTAVIEGLALRICQGDVPPALAGAEIIGLDLALLQAGASVTGEFERRLTAVLDEVKASPTPIVLFIDEAHTLIGAGGAAGTGDAANLLKPALARGELRTIAATTWLEYKRYIESDPALARRFQLVMLDEPSIAATVTMLRGLRAHYEKAHGVVIRDDAVVAAAELGSRYIAGRQHPDKGIDLIDTAAARVKVALTGRPAALQDADRRIEELQRERDAVVRDQLESATDHVRLERIAVDIAACERRREDLDHRWRLEMSAAEHLIALRSTRSSGAAMAAAAGGSCVDPKAQLMSARKALEDLQERDPLVHVEVTPQVIAQVIGDWTGIPVGSMVRDHAESLLRFEDRLRERIKGQDQVGEIIGRGIRSAKAGLGEPHAPMGVFLLVGPSGVGKTETAIAIAEELFGGERFMTTIAMSEFQERHAVSRLIGPPPGYIGYGDGGALTEAVRQRPYSVVLLDEVEKADIEVMNLFYQVFDKGILNDSEGRSIDFKDTIILLTSNLASDLIVEACADAHPSVAELVARIRPTLSRHFKPALLARMTIVPYRPVRGTALADIARLKLQKVAGRLAESHGVELACDDAVVEAIVARCTEVDSGARNIDHIIAGTMLPRIASILLERMATGRSPAGLRVVLDARDGFAILAVEHP